MKQHLRLALGLIVCVLLSSCVVTSDNPLAPPETAKADPRLIGDWFEKKDQDTYRITVKSAPWMHVDVIPSNPRDKRDSYDFYPTTIGKNSYLNVVLIGDDKAHPSKAYTFIRYTISDNSVLHLWTISQDATAAAVRAGKLRGIVRQDKDAIMEGNPPHPDVDVALTDASATLAKFVEDSNATELFNDKMEPLERITKK